MLLVLVSLDFHQVHVCMHNVYILFDLPLVLPLLIIILLGILLHIINIYSKPNVKISKSLCQHLVQCILVQL